MKKVLFKVPVIYFLLMLSLVAFSQDKASAIGTLLLKYYDIKNALVNSEPDNVVKGATAFSTALKAIDFKTLPTKEQKALSSVQTKLLTDANSIAGTKDLAKQRALFQSFSDNIIILVKSTPLTQAAYITYCPMKKAYWISSVQQIKNPYYGSSMLTCGNVTETVK